MEGRGVDRRVGRRVSKGEGAKKGDSRVWKRKDICPSNARSGVWHNGWVEKDVGAKIDGAVC
jgi:hypothetical protein